VFVGSLNIDPRSRLLKTEIGVIVDCPPLAAAVTEYFGTATQPGNAYELVLEPPNDPHGKLRWQPSDGKGDEHAHEPGANPKRRMQVALMRLFPIDGLL
jgi:putative cardiolipin synthase